MLVCPVGVLMRGRARFAPPSIAASKSTIGHSEPASGLMGLITALHSITNASALPILHLRALNPHIDALIQSSPSASRILPLGISRQRGGQPRDRVSHNGGSVAWGTSAFAFQGTNAHAILQSGSSSSDSLAVVASGVKPQWQQSRFWVTMAAHHLVQKVQTVRLQTSIP